MYKIQVTNKHTKQSKYMKKKYKTESGAKRGLTCYLKSSDKYFLLYPPSRYTYKIQKVKKKEVTV